MLWWGGSQEGGEAGASQEHGLHSPPASASARCPHPDLVPSLRSILRGRGPASGAADTPCHAFLLLTVSFKEQRWASISAALPLQRPPSRDRRVETETVPGSSHLRVACSSQTEEVIPSLFPPAHREDVTTKLKGGGGPPITHLMVYAKERAGECPWRTCSGPSEPVVATTPQAAPGAWGDHWKVRLPLSGKPGRGRSAGAPDGAPAERCGVGTQRRQCCHHVCTAIWAQRGTGTGGAPFLKRE